MVVVSWDKIKCLFDGVLIITMQEKTEKRKRENKDQDDTSNRIARYVYYQGKEG